MDKLLRKTMIAAITGLVLYLVLFFFLDRTIDLWVYKTCADTWVFTLSGAISCLATGEYIKLALAVCLILTIVIDPGMKRRWTKNLLFICVSCSIAIIIGEGFKYLHARFRPVMYFEHGIYGFHFFSTDWALNSTPSGHTYRAFSILTALSLLYRRYTVVFIFIATVIGVSRVFVTAHYPSDVVFGVFLGVFTAA